METEQTTGTGRHGLAAVLARWLIEAETNLRAWTENPPGYLVPTEPDPGQRALVRIGLRAQIYTLCKALDEAPPPSAEADNHRDLQRIRDEAQNEMLARMRQEAMAELSKIDVNAAPLRTQLEALFNKHRAKLAQVGDRLYTVDDIVAIVEGREP